MATQRSATVRQIEKASKHRFQAVAATIPSEVVDQIKARAQEAIASGEVHQMTGGWVVIPFKGSYDMIGLLQVASAALKNAQGL